jgi:hypothetical protein
MTWRRCSNKSIVADVPFVPGFFVASGDLIAMIYGTNALISGCALDFLTMFIHPSDEHHVMAFEPLKAS